MSSNEILRDDDYLFKQMQVITGLRKTDPLVSYNKDDLVIILNCTALKK